MPALQHPQGRSKVIVMKVGTKREKNADQKARERKEMDFVHKLSTHSISEQKHLSQDGEKDAAYCLVSTERG